MMTSIWQIKFLLHTNRHWLWIESKIFASLSMAFHGIENMKEETYLRSLEIKYSTAFRCHRIKAADHSVMRRSIFY